jgi:hypothetical protein
LKTSSRVSLSPQASCRRLIPYEAVRWSRARSRHRQRGPDSDRDGVQGHARRDADLGWRIPRSDDTEQRLPPPFPYTDDADDDTVLTVGWNIARRYGLTREQMDAWALRSHRRAVATTEAGVFADEIAPIKVSLRDGSVVEFAADEHPRSTTSAEKMAALPPLRP